MSVTALPAVEMTAREFNALMRKMGRAVLELYAARTLFEEKPPSAPAGFAGYLHRPLVTA